MFLTRNPCPHTPGTRCHRAARRGHPSPCGIRRHSRMVRPINRSPTDRPGGPMTLVAQRWNNPWHGRAAGAAIRRTLEDGCLGPPSGVRRAGRRHRGPHRDVVGIHAVGPGRRGAHLGRRRGRHVGGVLLVPARASRATTWVLVDAVHADPRHGPRPVVGPAVLTVPPTGSFGPPRRRRLGLRLARFSNRPVGYR